MAADTAAGPRLTHGAAVCRCFSPTHPVVLMNVVTLEELCFGSSQFWHKQGVQVLFDLSGTVFIWDLGRTLQGGLLRGFGISCCVTHQDLLVEPFYQQLDRASFVISCLLE